LGAADGVVAALMAPDGDVGGGMAITTKFEAVVPSDSTKATIFPFSETVGEVVTEYPVVGL